MESFGRMHEKTKCLHCLQQAFFFVLFKEKQLTWRHKNWTTKPQQGKRKGLKDELGGMGYPSLRWLLGAENVYWYGYQGGETNKVDTPRPGGLWKCYRKWENMSMNQMQEWKQSQTGFGFVTVSSGNIAVGGLWLQEARKWTQTFLSSPNCCWCKSRRNNHPCGGLNKSESRLQRTDNNNGMLVSMCSCQMKHVQGRRPAAEMVRGEKWRNSFSEETNGGCCAMAPLTAEAVDCDQTDLVITPSVRR